MKCPNCRSWETQYLKRLKKWHCLDCGWLWREIVDILMATFLENS